MQFDRVAATCAALVVVGLVVFLLVRNEQIADPRLFSALHLILSFGVAVLGATIPGVLRICGWTRSGVTIRAGGALALFALAFLYTPNLVTKQSPTTINASAGVAAGEIKNSPITVNPSQSSTVISAPGGVAAGEIKNSPITVNPSPSEPSRRRQ